MRRTLHARSLLIGLAASAGLVLVLAALPPQGPDQAGWSYQILLDVEDKQLQELSDGGWEFAGYLGVSKRGSNTDETLWRKRKD